MLDDEVIKVNKKECEGRQFHSILISGDRKTRRSEDEQEKVEEVEQVLSG